MMCRAWIALVTAAVVLTVGPGRGRADGGAPTTITRHFSPASERYQYVPFDVPAGATRLRVTYQYDRAGGENVVDLGVFEPGSLDLGTSAFRGYSGGARTAVEIAGDTATPGYRPGPLPEGQWHVLLGLYKVAAAGVDVALTIDTASVPPAAAPGPAGASESAASPVAPEAAPAHAPGWFTGALHTHTLHSDGTVTPAELLRRFGEAGFDFVAITDHNNTTHRFELGTAVVPGRPLWIVGEEVTTPGGHASVWGLDAGAWIDFRVMPGDLRIRDLVATARRHGAVFSVNHPVSSCLACGWTHAFVEGIDGIEISNGRHGEVSAAMAVWDGLLREGRRITAVGSSDWHAAPSPLDVAHVRVYATSLTTPAILEAIRHGRVIVMQHAADATPDVVVRSGGRSARVGDILAAAPGTPLTAEISAPGLSGHRVWAIANGARRLAGVLDAGGRIRVEQPAPPGYIRFEIEAPDGSPRVITNPVYLVP